MNYTVGEKVAPRVDEGTSGRSGRRKDKGKSDLRPGLKDKGSTRRSFSCSGKTPGYPHLEGGEGKTGTGQFLGQAEDGSLPTISREKGVLIACLEETEWGTQAETKPSNDRKKRGMPLETGKKVLG